MSAPFWVDIIEDVVDAVRAGWTTRPSGLPAASPYYLYGHPREIVTKLLEIDRSNNLTLKKYPLFALIMDFEEDMGQDQKVPSSTSLRIVIAHSTRPDYDSVQRYDESFRPILYPLYDLFIEKLIASGYFVNVGDGLGGHTKIDRPFWGRSVDGNNAANIGNDHVDAIEIQNLQLDLHITQKIC